MLAVEQGGRASIRGTGNRDSKREQKDLCDMSKIHTSKETQVTPEALEPTYIHCNFKLAFYHSDFYTYKATAKIIAVPGEGVHPLKDELAQVTRCS